MGFPQYISDAALAASGRCCCICHKFCGTKIELHHIKQVAYGGEDTFENCIPLCFDCHADMGKADPKHNKGKKYSMTELVMHRDNWYRFVSEHGVASQENHREPVSVCDDDKHLYKTICDSFATSVCDWLAIANMYYPFNGELFTSLDSLLIKENNPLFSFENPDLECLKKQLFNSLEAFLETVSRNTFGIDKEHLRQYASRAWLLNQGYIEGRGYTSYEEAEEAFDKELDTLNEKAANLWTEYCRFAKEGRTIINRS